MPFFFEKLRGGSVSADKGKGIISYVVAGSDVGGTLDFMVVECCGLDCESYILDLDNSPWGESVFCEPINVCPLQFLSRLVFLDKKLHSG
jgi:hypothetical protein